MSSNNQVKVLAVQKYGPCVTYLSDVGFLKLMHSGVRSILLFQLVKVKLIQFNLILLYIVLSQHSQVNE